MGVDIRVENGYVEARCQRLRGAVLDLRKPSVTGTENLLMAATLADGETLIRNAAREPEIVDLAQALGAMGAKISGGRRPGYSGARNPSLDGHGSSGDARPH